MLDLRRVSCGYGGRLVLRDVSAAIDAGRIVGVIGPTAQARQPS